MTNLQLYASALIKSFPLGIVVVAIVIFGIYEAIENKWERRIKNDY